VHGFRPVNGTTRSVKSRVGMKTSRCGIDGLRIPFQPKILAEINHLAASFDHMSLASQMHFGGVPERQEEQQVNSSGRWNVTTNNARSAFLRSYHLPAILLHYPRLVRAMQGIAMLNGIEAAACIRDLKAGRRWSGEAVNRYGGTHKVATLAWKYRRAISLLPGSVA
jgi:hypothetical protein